MKISFRPLCGEAIRLSGSGLSAQKSDPSVGMERFGLTMRRHARIGAEGDGTINRKFFQSSRDKGKKSPPLVSDATLIAACLEGDLPSWDALIARYQGFIYTLIHRMGLSVPDADDVFQNVCISLFQHLSELRNADRLASWLAAITRQEVWLLARRINPLPMSDVIDKEQDEPIYPLGAQPPPDPEEVVLRLERTHLIRQALQHLSEPCRKLLSLLYREDPSCSYAEAAAQLQIPLGSIGPKRARCLEQLKKILTNYGY